MIADIFRRQSGTYVEPEPCRESACLAINDCFFGRCARPIEGYEDRTNPDQSGTSERVI